MSNENRFLIERIEAWNGPKFVLFIGSNYFGQWFTLEDALAKVEEIRSMPVEIKP